MIKYYSMAYSKQRMALLFLLCLFFMPLHAIDPLALGNSTICPRDLCTRREIATQIGHDHSLLQQTIARLKLEESSTRIETYLLYLRADKKLVEKNRRYEQIICILNSLSGQVNSTIALVEVTHFQSKEERDHFLLILNKLQLDIDELIEEIRCFMEIKRKDPKTKITYIAGKFKKRMFVVGQLSGSVYWRYHERLNSLFLSIMSLMISFLEEAVYKLKPPVAMTKFGQLIIKQIIATEDCVQNIMDIITTQLMSRKHKKQLQHYGKKILMKSTQFIMYIQKYKIIILPFKFAQAKDKSGRKPVFV